MSENKSDQPQLLLREVLNETILRDVLLFILLYLFMLTQNWDNLLLLLFPIISFSFALFFRIIGTNKHRIFDKENLISYNPLGAENKNADRLVFISLLELILLFWIGAESLYHPQLVDDFGFYFSLIYFLLYSFGFFWIFFNIWNKCKIMINLSDLENNDTVDKKLLITELGLNKIKLISYLNISIFITFNLINTILTILVFSGVEIGFPSQLPGTGIEDSQPLFLSYSVWIILIAFPIASIFFLLSIYRDVNSFSEIEFKSKINSLPTEVKEKIIKRLRSINQKLNNFSN